jgi:site-specific recombinase XerD
MAEGQPTMAADRPTIAAAIEMYLEDKRVQNLAESTVYKLELIFEMRLGEFCKNHALVYLDELNLAQLEKCRSTWKDAPLARKKKQERLVGFFHYCQRHGWIRDNPAQKLSTVKVTEKPTGYFTPEEVEALLAAVPQMYADKRGLNGRTPESLRDRVTAMLLLLRWSGLRIGDAVSLERERLTADGRIRLYMAKTGNPVFVLVPDFVSQRLHDLPNSNPKYFFWTGNGLLKTAVSDWQRTLRRLFDIADLGKRCHPHMFRDTFAVQYLLDGVPIDQVSLLLGHSSIKITEKHYMPFVLARQEQMEASIRNAWATAKAKAKKTEFPEPAKPKRLKPKPTAELTANV